MDYKMIIAGYPLYYRFRYERTADYFREFIVPADEKGESVIEASEEYIKWSAKTYDANLPYAEVMSCLSLTSNALIPFGYCSFHSVAVSVNGKGYLFAAKSGVGKSTQYMNLKTLYPENIQVINGDKPFLRFTDGKVIIYPSPWRGKENFGNDIVCELDSIIFLEQAHENTLEKMKPEKAVLKSLKQFLYYPDSEKIIHMVCDLDRRLLTDIPVYLFRNTGDLTSSDLLYKKLLADGDAFYE
ncbi:MAG: hypothetical protein Q4C20_12340 [Erysipelotrichaceae bacterium]|nr:hypothetical protein [Erysipelotrichaceae bacterium]